MAETLIHLTDLVECSCGHKAIRHHGTDPKDGCMIVGMRTNPKWCDCSKTCPEVITEWHAANKEARS